MITLKEYLEAEHRYPFVTDEDYEGKEKDKDTIREYNKMLIEKYPWLEPTNRWSGKKIVACSKGEKGFWPGDKDKLPEYDYDHTELDNMPEGWRIAFGEQLCDELQEDLKKFDYDNKYTITQIKEKYGYLHWYDGGVPVGKLSEEFEEIVLEDGIYPPHTEDEHIVYDRTENGKRIFKRYKILDKCRVWDIILKYEKLSGTTCIKCGKSAKWMTTGWVSPYCDECKEFLESNEQFYDSFELIEKE